MNDREIRLAFRHLVATPSDIWEHLPTLRRAAADAPPGPVIELGVGAGRSTIALMNGCMDTGRELWSIDCTQPYDWSGQLLGHPGWHFYFGDTRDHDLAAEFPDSGMIFLDTTHYYDDTLTELNLWAPHVKARGAFWLHDTGLEIAWPDAEDDDLRPKDMPVKRAAIQFQSAHSEKWGWTNDVTCGGLGVLRRLK